MKLNFYIVPLLLFLYSSNFALDLSKMSPIKYNYGDSLTWKNVDYDDSHWQYLFENEFDTDTNFIWLRVNVILDIDKIEDSIAIVIDMNTNYEVYWNGKFVGKNFKSKSITDSPKGVFDKYYIIKKENILQENTLAIRAKVDNNYFYLETLNFETENSYLISNLYLYGYLVLIIILNLLILYLTYSFFKELLSPSLKIVITVIILISVISLFMEFITFLGVISYEILKISFLSFDIFGYLLLYSLIIHTFDFIEINNGKIYLLIFGLFYLIAYMINLPFYITVSVTLGLLFILSIYYIRQNEIEAFVTLIFVLFLALLLISPLNIHLSNLGEYILIYFLVSIYLKKESKNRLKLAEIKVQKSVLETQLLKKIIQPHYLMNSLNTMLDLLEDSKNLGLKFIKEITEEFRLFISISEKKLIPIREEIRLCEHHAKIMSYRHDRDYQIKTNNINPNRNIPPAILQTLVENGITHGKKCEGKMCFIISENSSDDKTTYQLISICDNNCVGPSFSKILELKRIFLSKKNNIVEGNGLKYIRSRLSESYGEDWDFIYFGDETIWITEITIKNN